MKIKELDRNCKSCGEEDCNCLKKIERFNESLEKCKECEFPIYEGMNHKHSSKSKIERFIEEVEIRTEQRKKRTTMMIVANVTWILIVIFYLIFRMPVELYFILFFIFVGSIILIGKWFKVDPIPNWDDLED